MKNTKLNKNWNAAPITTNPAISTIDNGIEVSFLLDSTVFEHIDQDEMGSIAFFDVSGYKLHTATDEDSIRKRLGLKNDASFWGDFYELSKGQNDFSDGSTVVDATIPKKDLRHFIVLLQDGVFECLATEYEFDFKTNLAAILDEKYPKGYLNHYIAMFASQFDKPSIDNFKTYTDLYIQMESKKEFVDLRNELATIKKNNDLKLYLKYANCYELPGFGTKQLNEMIKVIEQFKV